VRGITLAYTPGMSQEDPRLAGARALIAKQVQQIKDGDLEAVRAGFTERLQDRITAESMQRAIGQLGTMTTEDLVASVEAMGESLKLKMKNGRTLTTLVAVDGAWKADTLWFK
jgi:hypothetical protein